MAVCIDSCHLLLLSQQVAVLQAEGRRKDEVINGLTEKKRQSESQRKDKLIADLSKKEQRHQPSLPLLESECIAKVDYHPDDDNSYQDLAYLFSLGFTPPASLPLESGTLVLFHSADGIGSAAYEPVIVDNPIEIPTSSTSIGQRNCIADTIALSIRVSNATHTGWLLSPRVYNKVKQSWKEFIEKLPERLARIKEVEEQADDVAARRVSLPYANGIIDRWTTQETVRQECKKHCANLCEVGERFKTIISFVEAHLSHLKEKKFAITHINAARSEWSGGEWSRVEWSRVHWCRIERSSVRSLSCRAFYLRYASYNRSSLIFLAGLP